MKKRLKVFRIRLLAWLAVFGPGVITANVDNDAGGITTYSVAGAQYGYKLLWIMPLVVVALIIVQEMSARLGVITGKGLADLIRETLGVRMTTLILGVLLIANLANTVSEFAGVAAGMEIFSVSKFISVPICALGVWLLIVMGNYKIVERVFLIASALYIAYIVSGCLAHPSWEHVLKASVRPYLIWDTSYLVLVITVIGTTIAPWMQFYQQSSIADKGLKPKDYAAERLDVILGSLFAVFVAAFIMISCAATIYVQRKDIQTAADAALALGPLAGEYAKILFAIGLLNASVFSAAILPLSTAYVVCEAFGWECGVSRNVKEAPVFFGIYTAFIVIGALVVLLPLKSLVWTMMASQTLNGILLPIILLVMLRLVNDRRLMGDYVNSRALNWVSGLIVMTLIMLTGMLVISPWIAPS